MKNLGKILSPNDPVLIEKTLQRLAEQDTWNDVFSTKLIELLDSLDVLKSEIRDELNKADERVLKAKGELATAQEAYTTATARIETVRRIMVVLSFALAVSWVAIVWLAWMTHPFAIYAAAGVSVFLIIGITALARWFLYAR